MSDADIYRSFESENTGGSIDVSYCPKCQEVFNRCRKGTKCPDCKVKLKDAVEDY